MRTYLLCHTHGPSECPVAFAAWSGFDSPLRAQLVTKRTVVTEVKEVLVP